MGEESGDERAKLLVAAAASDKEALAACRWQIDGGLEELFHCGQTRFPHGTPSLRSSLARGTLCPTAPESES